MNKVTTVQEDLLIKNIHAQQVLMVPVEQVKEMLESVSHVHQVTIVRKHLLHQQQHHQVTTQCFLDFLQQLLFIFALQDIIARTQL